jgi:hypothetical protein
MNWIRNAILRWARNRQPDFVIGGPAAPYLRRHWLIPRNRFFNIYVHEFLRSDDDRALHDHPWLFNASWLIEGEYIEWSPADDAHLMPDVGVRQYPEQPLAGRQMKFRWGPAPHRVELITEVESGHGWSIGFPLTCWTVFITGPVVRTWGFHCPKRWVPWKEFVDSRDAGAIGKGCDA